MSAGVEEEEDCVVQWSSRSVWEWVLRASTEGAQSTLKGILGQHWGRRGCNLCLLTKRGLRFGAVSHVLDGLEDKDVFYRTLERHGLTDATPETTLVLWDATHVEEFDQVLVLKSPLGSSGEGIHLVHSASEVLAIVTTEADKARAEPGFLASLRPDLAWALQSQVEKPLLVDGRRFSVRCYVVVVERQPLKVMVHRRCEARLAAEQKGTSLLLRSWFLTNGAGAQNAVRCLLEDLPNGTELCSRVIETVAGLFASLILPEMEPRRSDFDFTPFAFGAVDLMIDENLRPTILEVNRTPAAPPRENLSPKFDKHLTDLSKELISLLLLTDDDDGPWRRVVAN